MERIAIYPGTFDPITVGHQDIIRRATRLCDVLYVCVATGHHKKTLFNLDERTDMAKNVINSLALDADVRVMAFSGLLIETCREVGAKMIIRGLRAVSDYEYEMQLAAMNRHLAADIETIFLTPSEHLSFISSTMVREVARLGGDLGGLVAPYVHDKFVTDLQRDSKSV
nr:pantetheine-phosphate adenylyltransferase [Suttonella sp. R2A3]